MRRLALLTCAASLAIAALAPAPASAGPVDKVLQLLEPPYDCVQDCDGPPPA